MRFTTLLVAAFGVSVSSVFALPAPSQDGKTLVSRQTAGEQAVVSRQMIIQSRAANRKAFPHPEALLTLGQSTGPVESRPSRVCRG